MESASIHASGLCEEVSREGTEEKTYSECGLKPLMDRNPSFFLVSFIVGIDRKMRNIQFGEERCVSGEFKDTDKADAEKGDIILKEMSATGEKPCAPHWYNRKGALKVGPNSSKAPTSEEENKL